MKLLLGLIQPISRQRRPSPSKDWLLVRERVWGNSVPMYRELEVQDPMRYHQVNILCSNEVHSLCRTVQIL